MPIAGKITVCHPENVTQFNADLRETLPEAHALAREMHKRGMIDGLRGARIADKAAAEAETGVAVMPVLSQAAESRLADLWWAREHGGAK